MLRRLLFPALLVVTLAAAADRRPIKATDIYDFHWLADPRIAPDGKSVIYTYVSVNAKKDGYDTALYVVSSSGGTPRQLTAGPQDQSARWSPDGKSVAFLRGRPAQIFVLPMEGGEARPLTEIGRGAGTPVWSPDGKRIAFTSAGEKDKEKDEDKSDVRVITRAVYRFNGAGYMDYEHPSHIWTVAVPEVITATQKAAQVTSGRFSEADPTWSRDGAKIYFTSNRDPEPYYKPQAGEVYAVASTGGEIRPVAKVDGAIRNVSLDPEGKRIAFVSALNGKPVKSHAQPDLWVADLAGGTPKNLTATFDNDINSGVGGDQAPPRGGGETRPIWTVDGRYVIINAAEQGRSNLKRVEVASGKVEDFTTGDQDVYSWSASADGSKLAVAISTSTNIGDLYLVDGASGKPTRITNINEKLFSELQITEPEMIWYPSFDGRKIQAWVQRPPDWTPGKKYPLILNIHGGPHAAYGYTFDQEFHWMAAKGYIVLYPNPRGSTSYGEEFGNVIQYHYPGDDYKDLMAGVDELVRRGWVDPEKLAVTGGSGGGVLTNWTIGHTDRFKAAVSQRSIADWRDFWYTADFTLFEPTWFRGGTVAGRKGLQGTIADHLHRLDQDADDVCGGGSGHENAPRRRRRADVSRAKI